MHKQKNLKRKTENTQKEKTKQRNTIIYINMLLKYIIKHANFDRFGLLAS